MYHVQVFDRAGLYLEKDFDLFSDARDQARDWREKFGVTKVIQVCNGDRVDIDTDGLTEEEKAQLE